ncbi:class I SAM-dependent methyltransferase [Nannocystis sp.]|uniref:class I SAM-dependent methyltransferase n=1 Tax=Nannocystis sp. TaxID=1962667 RepID=UPI0025E0A7B2|nr:class I SAM-dependent methyltransferase [Nannocystis sp.]
MTPRAALLAAALLACAPPPPPPSPVLQDMTVSTGPKAPVPTDILPKTTTEAPATAPLTAPLAAPPTTPDPRLAETRSNDPRINAPYRARGAAPRWARRFERDGREVHDHRAEIVRALALRPGMAIADLGAGTGLFTVAFAEAVGPTGTVYAVDLIPAFLAHIRKKIARAGLTQVQLIQASDRSAELPPASVDLVFMSDVYHHLEYPQHVLASLRQALRPGGSLWVIDFQREPGRSPAWVLSHVRAGKAEVLRELALAGFELVAEPPLLRDNYVLQLRPRAG